MTNICQQNGLHRLHRRDPELDGRLWVANAPAGRYCRPSCQAYSLDGKTPEIFQQIEAAKNAGLKACSKCRPDRFQKVFDPDEILARDMRAQFENSLNEHSNSGLVETCFGFGRQRWNELCQRFYQKKPEALVKQWTLMHWRRLLAKRGREQPESDWIASFFDHGSRVAFERAIGLSMEAYTELATVDQYAIKLPESFRQDLLIPYWLRDPHNAIFQKKADWFWRSFQVGEAACLVRARFENQSFEVRLEQVKGNLNRWALYEQIRRILGLDHDPASFEGEVIRIGHQRLLGDRLGLRLVRTPTVYEALVWTIIGQQINLAFAYKLRNRLIRLAGVPMGDDMFAHPTPQAVAGIGQEALQELQFSRSKSAYLTQISKRIADGLLDVEGLVDQPVTYVERCLLAERGIGRWTALYMSMRGCGFEDCVPVGDAGLKNALKKYFDLEKAPQPMEVEARMTHFKPYRSFATFHLWRWL